MLPFLKRKSYASGGVIIEPSKSIENTEEINPEAARIGCAYNIMEAIKANDVKALADALYDAFTIMESEPHNESPEPHSYDAQNLKAGKSE